MEIINTQILKPKSLVIGLDMYPKHFKGKQLHEWIMDNLRHRKTVTVFEITADKRMARTIEYLTRIGRIKFENKDYPSCKIITKN